MNLRDKWMLLCDGAPSPENYLTWAYKYLIAATLRRCVWCPPEHDRIYSNMYVTLVGAPGVGKGFPIRLVSSILQEPKLGETKNTAHLKGAEKAVADAIIDNDIKVAQEDMTKGKTKEAAVEEALLIPVAADAVTYEALVQSMASCVRRVNYLKTMPDGNQRMAIYSHSSQCFCLEEIASLFRKHQNDLINFLIQAYDCGESYEYRTKTQGRDRILRMCLNFIGGTTPDFMQEVFSDALVNQGYSSRTFYIYGHKNRKSVFFRPELTEQQREYKKEIVSHVKEVAKLHGQVRIDDDTVAFLQKWKEQFDENPKERASQNPKMRAYYARKNIHIMKVAMANHFGVSTEMYLSKADFEQAIEELHEEEKTMQLALTIGSDNPLAKSSAKVHEHLMDNGKQNFKELLAFFWEQLRQQELEEVLNFLQKTDQVVTRTIEDETTGESFVYYIAK